MTHVALWAVFIGVPLIFQPAEPSSPKALFLLMSPEKRSLLAIGLHSCMIIFFYFNFFVLLPRFYLKGKTWQYFIAVLLVYVIFQMLIDVFRAQALSTLPPGILKGNIISFSYMITSIFFLLLWGASSGFRLGEEWRRAENLRRETEKQRLEAELTLLKSQINPHFLLNSLNNLYVLALTVPLKTPDAILKLSELIAFILYECDKPKIPLSKDLHFIENYIALQRFRLAPNATIHAALPDSVPELLIEPMILISFIENAFKHGLTTKTPCNISIAIQLNNNRLSLRVENMVFPPKFSQDGNISGIGLSNTKKRLEYSYPEKHELKIIKNNEKYIVDLQIDL